VLQPLQLRRAEYRGGQRLARAGRQGHRLPRRGDGGDLAPGLPAVSELQLQLRRLPVRQAGRRVPGRVLAEHQHQRLRDEPEHRADTDRAAVILDELAARLAKARSAGADAIEFDNVDAYQNKTGLTISAATQEQFDAAIANLAHTAGFAAGLKNDLGQAGDLQPYFDFAINEQCWQYRECNFPAPGLQAWPSTYGKAVFNVEYKLATSKFCPQANSASYNFNSILKDVNLYDVPYTPCR